MTENQTTNVLVKIMDMLTPLSAEDRQRVVKAALTLLGDDSASIFDRSAKDTVSEEFSFAPRANNWLKQNGLTMEELEQVFHPSEDGVEFIASDVPGKNHKERTHSAYILCGAQNLLSDGNPTFDDKAARTMCENLGCYNQANHAVYLKSLGNVVAGSKSKGWTLTAPGLKRAASIIHEICAEK